MKGGHGARRHRISEFLMPRLCDYDKHRSMGHPGAYPKRSVDERSRDSGFEVVLRYDRISIRPKQLTGQSTCCDITGTARLLRFRRT